MGSKDWDNLIGLGAKPTVKDLKQIVVGNNYVQFIRYHDGNLWYSAHVDENDYHNGGAQIMEFPVPISDIGNATFLARDRSMLFMRYIRKHLKMIEEAQNG